MKSVPNSAGANQKIKEGKEIKVYKKTRVKIK